jgi:hypothetical protein
VLLSENQLAGPWHTPQQGSQLKQGLPWLLLLVLPIQFCKQCLIGRASSSSPAEMADQIENLFDDVPGERQQGENDYRNF